MTCSDQHIVALLKDNLIAIVDSVSGEIVKRLSINDQFDQTTHLAFDEETGMIAVVGCKEQWKIGIYKPRFPKYDLQQPITIDEQRKLLHFVVFGENEYCV